MSELSLHQRIVNAAASQQVENVKAQHTYYHGRADATGEWANIWSKSDDCSWAHGFGRMRGFDQVWYGSVTLYDKMAFQKAIEMADVYPETGGKDPRPLLEASVHTLVTDIIEVAKDGMSARASFLTPGVIHSCLNPDKKKYCNFLWERYGTDFIYEDGKWKYLHEHVCPDLLGTMDNTNWAAMKYQELANPTGEPPREAFGGRPPIADEDARHQDYTPVTKPQNTVPWPEPYETLDEDNTYTPSIRKYIS